jgi:predicted DNA-binding protein (UPF0251 family)
VEEGGPVENRTQGVVVRTVVYVRGRPDRKAKLTDHEVELFRQLVEEGVSQAEACRKFEISQAHGSRLINFLRRL